MATLKITGSGNQNGCYVAVGGSTGTKLYTATSTRVSDGTTLYFYASGSQSWIGRVITLNGTIVGTSAYSATYYSHTVTGDIEVVFTNEGSYYSIAITTASDPGGDSGGSSASEHKTKVNGTACQLESGNVLIGGVGCEIESGMVLVGGVAREIEFDDSIQVTMSGYMGSAAYAIVGEGLYEAEAIVDVEYGCVVSVYVFAGDDSIADQCYIKMNGNTVKSEQGSYSFTVTEDTTIVFDRDSISVNGRLYAAYNATITTA